MVLCGKLIKFIFVQSVTNMAWKLSSRTSVAFQHCRYKLTIRLERAVINVVSRWLASSISLAKDGITGQFGSLDRADIPLLAQSYQRSWNRLCLSHPSWVTVSGQRAIKTMAQHDATDRRNDRMLRESTSHRHCLPKNKGRTSLAALCSRMNESLEQRANRWEHAVHGHGPTGSSPPTLSQESLKL